MATPIASAWNSLEVAKLVVAASIPIVVVGAGYFVNRSLRRLEEAQWANRQVIERRLRLYDVMAPMLNQLYCFFALIGSFRETTPPDAVGLKRELDAQYHVNRALMTAEFSKAYAGFMDRCFEPYTGVGQDAKLRTSPDVQRAERAGAWDAAWGDRFSDEGERTAPGEIRVAYENLMERFADELGVRPHNAGPVKSSN